MGRRIQSDDSTNVDLNDFSIYLSLSTCSYEPFDTLNFNGGKRQLKK